MSWKKDLRPATFRNVPFKVRSHNAEVGGRRGQVHVYPGRNTTLFEDLGLKEGEFSVDAYVVGDDYMAQRDRVIEACGQEGAGSLVHPYLGTKSVACTGCTLSESSDEGRMARLSLKFVLEGENKYPSARTDTARGVNLAADNSKIAARDAFARRFSIDGRPAFIRDSAARIVGDFANVSRLSAGTRLPTSIALGSQRISNNAGDLVRSPMDLAGEMQGLMSLLRTESPTSRAAVSSLRPMTTFGSTYRPVPLTTATRRQQAVNQSALTSFTRRSSTIEMARAAPSMDYGYRQEVYGQRDELAGLLDTEMDLASVDADDDVFRSLGTLRARSVTDLNGRAPSLAQLVTINPMTTEPALVTSYRYYGDASRTDELVTRNRIRHPGFVPGGRALEVLSNG